MDLNDQQRIAAQAMHGPILVSAAAGTGKTRVLISRINHLIEQGIMSHKILCFTFSNQAANEMINRCTHNDVWIGTFHKICFRILLQFSVLSSKTTIIDEYDQKKVWDSLDIASDMIKIKSLLDNNEQIPIKLLPIFQKYAQYLKDNDLVDFYHIIQHTINFLKENDIKLFDFIMVDEYQDTNAQQEELIQLLAKHQVNPNIFCVGDDDQCIYSWRGARISNFINFAKRYNGAQIFKLEYNYRSTMPIVNSAFNVVRVNWDRLDKRGWTDKPGDPVEIIFSRNEMQELGQIVSQSTGSVGILVRTVKQIGPIENQLVSKGIKYTVLGTKLTNKLEIKSLIYYLKVIIEQDKFSLWNMINYPRRGIGPAKIAKLEELLTKMDFFDAIETVAPQLFWLRDLSIDTPGLCSIILEKSGLQDIFTDEQKKNVMEFVANTPIQQCLDALGGGEIHKDRVCILTIHSSKGLEFDTVIIPTMTEGSFPVSIAIEEGLLNEERRICYVAFTRARLKLYLLYQTSSGGHYKFFGPSRFLKDLAPQDIKFLNRS